MQKGLISTWLVVGLIIVALIVGGGYWTYKTQVQKSQVFHDQYGMPIITPSRSPELTNKPTPETKPNPDDETANWRTYTNTKYNFNIKLPNTDSWEGQVPEVSTNNFRMDILQYNPNVNSDERSNITIIINKDDPSAIQTGITTEYSSTKNSVTLGSLNGLLYSGTGEMKDFSGKNSFKRFRADFIVSKNGTNFWFRLWTTPEKQDIHLNIFKQMLSTFKFN